MVWDDHVPRWPSMDDAQRAKAYSPSSVLKGSLDPLIQQYRDQSALAYQRVADVTTLQYGAGATQTIDLAIPAAAEPVPLLVFIHGGYWQELSKTDAFFLAPDVMARGAGFAAIDYTLAPAATVSQIVAECVQALAHLRAQAVGLGIDPARIVISGSSAGAHLAAMCCLKMPPAERPAGAVLLSGVFDLRPLVGTYVNDALGLDLAMAAELSPAMLSLAGFPPTVIAFGDTETDEFKRQSAMFARQLHMAGSVAQTLEVAGRNHFDIVHDLINDTALGQQTANLLATHGEI